MIMATGNIANKYHGARLWIPLNEEPPNQNTGYWMGTSLQDYWTTTHTVYDVVSGTSTSLQNAGNGIGETQDTLGIVNSAFASTLTSDLTGVGGWTTEFTDDNTGSYCMLPSGGNFSFPMGSAAETEKFSISVHGAITSGNSAARQYIFSKGITYNSGAPAGTGIAMLISGANNNAPVVQVYHAGTLLNSITPLPNDGSAFNVIYTYNSGSASGPDAKLYVNGTLEDYQASCNALGTIDKDLFIGTMLDNTNTSIWKVSGNPTPADAARVAGFYDYGGGGLSPTSTDGSGDITTTKFTATVATGGVTTFEMRLPGIDSGYAVDDTITFDNSYFQDAAITTFSGSPTSDSTRTNGTYDDIAPNSTTGLGTGIKFNCVVNSTPVTGTANFTLVSGGANVAKGDKITFLSSQIGGGTNVTLTVTETDATGTDAVLTVTDVGYPRQDQNFNGTIEEMVFYNHVLEVPQNAQEFIYTTANNFNVDSSDNLVTNNARLFLCDFHNIRGKSSKTQTSSNQVSWRATT